MVYLDCQSLDSALLSFAAACRRPVAAVSESVLSYTPDWTEPDVEADGPLAVFQSLGITEEDITFEGVHYFHGTRVFGPARFRDEGILPLGQVLDRLWASLHTLVAEEVTESGWRRLRADIEAGAEVYYGHLYRLKSERPHLHGPYALLAREHHLNPRPGHHDYLAIPEIVEDIAKCCGLDLASRFLAATTPCIVKFRTASIGTSVLYAVFWYIHGMLHDGAPGWLASCDYDGGGRPVPPGDVVAVEFVKPSIDRRGGPLSDDAAPGRREKYCAARVEVGIHQLPTLTPPS